MYCIMLEKETQKPPEHTSKHVNLKISWGHAPRPPHTIYNMGPIFLICPGPPQSSWQPCTPVMPEVLACVFPSFHPVYTDTSYMDMVVTYVVIHHEQKGIFFLISTIKHN